MRSASRTGSASVSGRFTTRVTAAPAARTGRSPGCRTSTAARWTGSSASASAGSSGAAAARRPRRPAPSCDARVSWATTTRASSTNYWAYAKSFVLSDHMFEPNWGWSLPAHLWLVSGWSARFSTPTDPSTCSSNLDGPTNGPSGRSRATRTARSTAGPISPTSCTRTTSRGRTTSNAARRRTARQGRSAATRGSRARTRPGCGTRCRTSSRSATTSRPATCSRSRSFYARGASAGRCRRSPGSRRTATTSEHPRRIDADGQAWVTRLVNAVMREPGLVELGDLPRVGRLGRLLRPRRPPQRRRERLRVARAGAASSAPTRAVGYVDHQTLSFDAYLKFIEDDFLGGARLDPKTDGRPDPRPTVREDVAALGDLARQFDFTQAPRPPFRPSSPGP